MWCIWYEDGSTFSSEDGLPQDAPKYGAILVTQTDDKFRKLLMNGDFFLYRADWDCWMECDRNGFLDLIVEHCYDISVVLPGRHTLRNVFNRAKAEAQEWFNDHC